MQWFVIAGRSSASTVMVPHIVVKGAKNPAIPVTVPRDSLGS